MSEEKTYSRREIIDEFRKKQLMEEVASLNEEIIEKNLDDEYELKKEEIIDFNNEKFAPYEPDRFIRKKEKHLDEIFNNDAIPINKDDFKDESSKQYKFNEKEKEIIEKILLITETRHGNFIKLYNNCKDDIKLLEKELYEIKSKQLKDPENKELENKYDEKFEEVLKVKKKLNEINTEFTNKIYIGLLNSIKVSKYDYTINDFEGLYLMDINSIFNHILKERSTKIQDMLGKKINGINKEINDLSKINKIKIVNKYFNSLDSSINNANYMLDFESELDKSYSKEHSIEEYIEIILDSFK